MNSIDYRNKSTINIALPHGITLKHTLRPAHACQVSWSPDGSFLAVGGGPISIWAVSRTAIVGELKGHSGLCVTTDWSPDGKFLASGGGDHLARIWSVKTGKVKFTLRGHKRYVRRVAWSPSGLFLASASDDATIRIWDTKTGRLLNTLQEHTDWVFGLQWLSDVSVVSGSLDGTVRIWEALTSQPSRLLTSHQRGVWSIACSSDRQLFASGGSRTIQLWDLHAGRQLATLYNDHTPNFLSFSADNRMLVSRDHYTTRIWACDTTISLAVLPEFTLASSPPDPAFHPSKPLLATVDDMSNEIRILKLDVNALKAEASITRASLRDEFISIRKIHASHPQKAGFAFETFLNKLFAFENLKPRKSFCIIGEQIDGAFDLDDETYIMEAKWTKAPASSSDLLIFRGKIEGKSIFTRGIFISLNGVSGNAKKAIVIGKQPTFFVIDGNDLLMVLSDKIDLSSFLRQRRRLLAQEGLVVVPFDTLDTGSL